jgi:hypothetical protein
VVVVALDADLGQRGAAAVAAALGPAVDDGVGVRVQRAPMEAAPRRLRLRRAVRPVGLLALRRRDARVVGGRRRAEALEQPADLLLERGDPGVQRGDRGVALDDQLDQLLAGEVVVGGGPSLHARENRHGNRIGRASPANRGTAHPDGSGHAS